MTTAQVDLVWIGSKPPDWHLGTVHPVTADAPSVAAGAERAGSGQAEGVLFWASDLPPPDPARVEELLGSPGDVWHGGLRLGMAGRPGLLDFVAPTWPLTLDAEQGRASTSWRVSLSACLARRSVVTQLGAPRPEFRSVSGAALEWGHRLIRRGALVRHAPGLVAAERRGQPLPLEDELRFIHYRFGAVWLRWAIVRAGATGYAGLPELLWAYRVVSATPPPAEPAPFSRPQPVPDTASRQVSVLIPTLDRYPYLATLLEQLGRQTHPAREVVVVDQTPRQRRDLGIAERFTDLPLRVIYQDQPGQCTARNAGLAVCRGEYVLFLDDDDEVGESLVALHLARLAADRSDVSSGIAEEVGVGRLPESFGFARASDVFPTNNTMIRRDVLRRSGLFDLAFDRGARADADLGIRLHLSGALMVLSPSIKVLHHRAPRGGLRVHGARVETYAGSRGRLFERHLPSATEIYLARRHFSARQAHEAMLLRIAGTFSLHGGPIRRLAKMGVSLTALPHTLLAVRERSRQAARLLEAYPQIPWEASR